MEDLKPPDTLPELLTRNEKEVQCVLCSLTDGTESKATFVCINCNENVCGTCLNKHITNKPKHTHTIIGLEDNVTCTEDIVVVSLEDEHVESEKEGEIALEDDAIVSGLDIEASKDFDDEEQGRIFHSRLSLLSIASSVYSSGTYPDTLCTVCAVDEEKMVDAVLFCFECRANMCVKCIRKHNNNKQRKYHTLKDMAGLTQPKPEDWQEDDDKQYLQYDCSFCKWAGEIRQAIRRCLDCKNNYCFTCLRWHNKCEHNQNHVLYYLPGMGIGKGTELCQIHPEETVDKFCPDHDVVGCNLCIHQSHKECENIEDVSSAAESIKDTEELAETKHMVTKTKQTLMKLLQKRQEDMERIKDERANIVYQLHINKERIVKHIESLESKIKEKLETKYKLFVVRINQDITKLEKMLTTLETQATQLQTVYHDNESQLFVNVKQAKKSRDETDILIQKVDNSGGRETINFVLNTDVADMVCDQQSMGVFSFDTAELHGEFSVKTDTDKKTCWITGASLMPDGTIAIIDHLNKKLKQLDHTYKVISEYYFVSKPYDVCMISSNKVVVTMPMKHRLQFVTFGNKISLIKSFRIRDMCWGVAYSEGKLFVACGGSKSMDEIYGRLDVFNIDGTLLQSYASDRNKKHLFSLPRSLCIGFNRNHIHIPDPHLGVITLDTKGNIQWVFNDPELEQPVSVCVAYHETLLVCGAESHNVFLIDGNGHKKAILLKQSDGIKYPYSLLYDKANMRLLVFNYQVNEFSVYNLISK